MKMMEIFKKNHPKRGYAYAVCAGDYVGEMLVFVEEQKGGYGFLSIPKNQNRIVPVDKFMIGIRDGIVDPVQKIDRKVFKLLDKQYNFNKSYTPVNTKTS